MRKSKTGRRVEGGAVVVKEGTPGGPRKIRCPRCHAMITSSRKVGKQDVAVCTACGAEFTSQPF